jgi:hypothetical protein
MRKATKLGKSLAGALAVFLAVVASTGRAETFPIGHVFRPLTADPMEPRFFLGWLSVDRSEGSRASIATVGGGTNFGLLRWPGTKAGEGWQLGIFGSIFSQFDMDSSADDLINSDYRFGVPLSYNGSDFSARGRIFHQSSHLGDEVILDGSAPQRIDLSYEAADLVLARQIGNWRPYGGGFYILRSSMDDMKKTGLQAGVDYAGNAPVIAGARVVGGLDVKWNEETDWRTGVSAKIGLEFGRPWPERRGVTVLLEAYDGPAPFGQYFRHDVTYQGVSVQFDL